MSSLCYSHLIRSHFEYGKQRVNITSKRVDFQLYPLWWSDKPQIPPPPQTPVFLIMDTFAKAATCETTVFKAIWDYHQNGYWQTLWSSSLLWYCCGSSILSMVLVSDNGALPVSLASLTERPLAHCSSTDTLHCRWFPLSSRLQAANRECSACVWMRDGEYNGEES